MRRLQFIVALGGAAAWPLTASAQERSESRLLAILLHGSRGDPLWERRLASFREELERLGWVAGQTLKVELRYTGGEYDRLPQLAHELVSLKPDLIFSNTTPAIKALQHETASIPIVFVEVSDPVNAGLVASLPRPASNITGLLFYENSIVGKWLGMLKEIAPFLTRIAFVGTQNGFPYGYFLPTAKMIAPSIGLEIVPLPITSGEDIKRSIETFARDPNGGLLSPNDTTVEENRDLILTLAARYRIPAIYAFRDFVTAGGLMYYGTDLVTHFRRAASYVDRVLRGVNPADLPVEAPRKYETVLNLKTAEALGLQVPPSLLGRADEVIE